MIHPVWRAFPVDWFARRYRVEEGADTVGTLEFGGFTERGAIELPPGLPARRGAPGRRLTIRREGFWHPTFRLAERHEELARARSAGAFRRGFYLEHGDEEYRLDPGSFFGRSYDLTCRGRFLGQIRYPRLFSRQAHIELDDELAPELRLFAFWLFVLSQRRSAAAS